MPAIGHALGLSFNKKKGRRVPFSSSLIQRNTGGIDDGTTNEVNDVLNELYVTRAKAVESNCLSFNGTSTAVVGDQVWIAPVIDQTFDIQSSNTGSIEYLGGFSDENTNSDYVFVLVNASGRIGITRKDTASGVNDTVVSSTVNVIDGDPHSIRLLVESDTVAKVYVDDVLVLTTSVSKVLPDSATFVFGAQRLFDNTFNHYSGKMWNAKVKNGADIDTLKIDGQSWMVALPQEYGTLPVALQSPQTNHIFSYSLDLAEDNTNYPYVTDSGIALQPVEPERWGPEIALVNSLYEKSGRPLSICKFADGGEGLRSYFRPVEDGYTEAVRIWEAHIAYLDTQKLNANLRWVLFWQSDTSGGTASYEWGYNFRWMVNQFCSDVGQGQPKCIVYRIARNLPEETFDPDGVEIVGAVQDALGSDHDWITVIDTDDYPYTDDLIHNNSVGVQMASADAFDICAEDLDEASYHAVLPLNGSNTTAFDTSGNGRDYIITDPVWDTQDECHTNLTNGFSRESNLFYNGDFDSSVSWILSTGWAIDGGNATKSTVDSLPIEQYIVGLRNDQTYRVNISCTRSSATGSLRLNLTSFGGETVNFGTDGELTGDVICTDETAKFILNPSTGWLGDIHSIEIYSLAGDVPLLLDKTIAADGSEPTNEGVSTSGATHNGAESLRLGTDAQMLASTLYSPDGLTFTAFSFAEAQAFLSGTDNHWLKWGLDKYGSCMLVEDNQYAFDLEYTVAMYNRFVAFYKQGDCGGGFVT